METTGPARKWDGEEQRLAALGATKTNPFLAADRSVLSLTSDRMFVSVFVCVNCRCA